MAGHNKSRFVQDLLQKTEGKPPSFTVNLYPDYWSLNNGARFHYHIPMASLLDDIRAQRIPVDFLEIFDSARVPFYDGCMIVQILDYRPQNPKDPVLEKAEQTRVVLHPSSESLWADICSLNQRYGTRWTDVDALEVEARVLLATSSPLCLDPDPHLTRMANHIMRATMLPVPAPLKRKAAAMEHEDDENDKARKIKILQHMATRPNRTAPSFQLFDAIQQARQNREAQKSSAPAQQTQPSVPLNPSAQSSPAPQPPDTPAVNGVQLQSPTESQDDKKKVKKRKSETPQTPFATTSFIRANGTQTPAPPTPTTHQFVHAHPPAPTTASSPAPPNVQSPMQIPVYSAVQPVPDSTLRVSTPLQPTTSRYTQSPRPPSRTTVSAQQAQKQPQPQPPHVPPTPQTVKPPFPAALPSYSPQQVGQQFIPQQQPARNGVQKPTPAALAAMAAHMPYQHMYPQSRNLQQQQQQQRLQSQKMGGRATPQAGVASPAQQPHAALSPANQASSPLPTNQQSARSPMPNGSQATQAQASVVQQPQQAQSQARSSSMPRSPAQQPGLVNLRGMIPTNPAAHQALVVRTGMPSNPTVTDHHQQPQHHAHPQVPTQPMVQQPRPSSQPTQPQQNQPSAPTQTQQPQATQHPQQPITHQQLQHMYHQMYGFHQVPFNVQGTAGRLPQGYWGSMGMGIQGIPNMTNMTGIAGMQGIQGVPGMQGVQGMASIPPGMMAGVQGIGRGIPMGAQQMASMATAAGAGVGHVPGAGGQGKAAVQGGMQR